MKSIKELLNLNFVQRLLIFLIGIPFCIFLIFIEVERHNWPLSVILLLISIVCAFESAQFFGLSKKPSPTRAFALVFDALYFPVLAILWVFDIINTSDFWPLLSLLILIIFCVQVFHKRKKPEEISPSLTAHVAVLFYPGFFYSHIIMIAKLDMASILYLSLYLCVIVNDTIAYIAGQIFKKYSTYPSILSPNKTSAGFFFGFIFSPIVLYLCFLAFPLAFPGGGLMAVLLGALIGIATIVGDLIESGLKRSSNLKNSGEIIPGRGGLLDSLDSILYSAPIFFYGFQLLNNIWIL